MKRPSFQFYPLDWLGDPNVIAMTPTERGAYIQLLATMWTTDDCSLKADQDYLAKISQVDKVVITAIYHCFKVVKGVLRHPRLDKERIKQDEYRQKQSFAGKKGMKNRWHKPSNKVVITKHNSSTSTSTSSSVSTNVDTAKPEYGNPEINKILEALRKTVGIDDFKEPKLKQRQYGKHLSTFLKKIGKEEFRRRLDIILSDGFKRKNCGSLSFLYREIRAFIEPKEQGIFIS